MNIMCIHCYYFFNVERTVMSEKCAIVLTYVFMLVFVGISTGVGFYPALWYEEQHPGTLYTSLGTLITVITVISVVTLQYSLRIIRREYCKERALNALYAWHKAVDNGLEIDRTEIFMCEIDCRQHGLQSLAEALRDKLK